MSSDQDHHGDPRRDHAEGGTGGHGAASGPGQTLEYASAKERTMTRNFTIATAPGTKLPGHDNSARPDLEKRMKGALVSGDLRRASVYADQYAHRTAAELRHEHYVSVPKLQHDIQQLNYLRTRDVKLCNAADMIHRYQQVIDSAVRSQQPAAPRWRITDAEYSTIGCFYNRIVHRPQAGHVTRALAPDWDRSHVEARFLEEPGGLATVDGFLSPDALEQLRVFCLESVVWSDNRYADERLGTSFARGFNCPLLLQIGAEIASAFPRIIGPGHRLRQVRALKDGPCQPQLASQADFAAVKVSIWLTPDSANLDPATGGLCVPRPHARTTEIPYRCNRATVLNSELIQATQPVSFAPGYQNRRLSVTFLFGVPEKHADRAARASRDCAKTRKTA